MKGNRMGKNSVTASELKVKSAQILERVVQSRTPVIITRRGRAIARLVPVDEAPPSLFGIARGSVTVLGDIVNPIDVSWEASR
jgi:prevent-host-death family protein